MTLNIIAYTRYAVMISIYLSAKILITVINCCVHVYNDAYKEKN